MRPLIIHYHIFKNAGSSLDLVLEESLEGEFARWDPGDDADAVYGPRDVISFIRQNVDCRAVTSHTLRLPPPALHGVKVYPLLFLRHPVLRAASVFKYDRSIGIETERQRVAKEASFADYVRWCLHADIMPIFKDFQTLYLSSEQLRFEDSQKARPNKSQFTRAIDVIEGLDIFGIVERFADSMQLFRKRLKHAFPEIRWRDIRENATGNWLGTLEEIQSELGRDLYEQLLHANRYDLALYERAVQIFGERLEIL